MAPWGEDCKRGHAHQDGVIRERTLMNRFAVLLTLIVACIARTATTQKKSAVLVVGAEPP